MFGIALRNLFARSLRGSSTSVKPKCCNTAINTKMVSIAFTSDTIGPTKLVTDPSAFVRLKKLAPERIRLNIAVMKRTIIKPNMSIPSPINALMRPAGTLPPKNPFIESVIPCIFLGPVRYGVLPLFPQAADKMRRAGPTSTISSKPPRFSLI